MATKSTSLYDKVRNGINVPERTAASHKWFQQKVKDLKGNVNALQFLKDPHFYKKTTFKPGFMYQFLYDAKNADTLPYWDRFPLIVAVGPAAGGFYGLNLHYLHPITRARLLDKLTDNVNNTAWDETTKMRFNYDMLTSVGRLKAFAPCFKHYLFSQIESRIMLIPSSEWEISIFLPTEKFIGAHKTKVWRESKRQITGYRA
jgi:hypothetical protein